MRPLRSNKGFTLVECLVAIAISSIVAGAIYSTLTTQNRCYEAQAQLLEMQDSVRTGIELMSKELIMAGYDPLESAGAGMISADASTVRSTADFNGDGDASDANEDIKYTLDVDAGTVFKNDTIILSNNIPADGLQFTYYDVDNTVMATPISGGDLNDIRRITINLTARTSRSDPTYGYRTMSLNSDISPRNLSF